jgi:hypothetical protein
MTNIMIDMTNKNKRHEVNICTYCNSNLFPRGRLISPNDRQAKQTEKGDWKCGVCVTEDVKKSLSLFGGPKK